MSRLNFSLAALGMALLFGFHVPLADLDNVAPSLLITMAIVVGALLMRSEKPIGPGLRGLDPVKRCRLTRRMVERSQDYGRLIALFSVTMAGMLALTAVGAQDIANALSQEHQRLMAGVIGAALGICLVAVPEIARRDLEILRMEKRLVDAPRGSTAASFGSRSDNVIRFSTLRGGEQTS